MDGPDTHPFAQQRGIPDPHAVGGWDRAITRLLQGIRDREVLLVLTGPAGVGKSAVLSAVIAALARKRMRVVGLDNAYTPHWNLRQLIGHILGRPAMGPIDREMAAAFVRLSAAPAGEPAIVVVVDDAQTLTDQALEYLLGIASLARHLYAPAAVCPGRARRLLGPRLARRIGDVHGTHRRPCRA